MRCLAVAISLALTISATSGAQAGARVYEGTLTLPSYAEGPPDVNPPFDVLQPAGRPNYPYTIRDQLTDRRMVKSWRAIYLENEYLKCSILPDLGGHLYGCTDKVNGQEMFYANTAMKFSNIAYRGSWAAFGIEFNFPVSHNWMTTSPFRKYRARRFRLVVRQPAKPPHRTSRSLDALADDVAALATADDWFEREPCDSRLATHPSGVPNPGESLSRLPWPKPLRASSAAPVAHSIPYA